MRSLRSSVSSAAAWSGGRAGENLQQRRFGSTAGELARRGPVGRRGACEPPEQFVERFLAVIDGGPLVVGERDDDVAQSIGMIASLM